MGELVCVDYERCLLYNLKFWFLKFFRLILDQGSQYYQQPSSQPLNAQDFIQSINEIYTVSSSVTFPTNRTSYQVKYIISI